MCFLASGERAVLLTEEEVEGQTAKAVKQVIATKIGVSRFKQRLLVEDGSQDIQDEEFFASGVKPKLVVLEFWPLVWCRCKGSFGCSLPSN